MLTFESIRAELAKVAYWNYRFVLYPHRFEGIWLSIIAELPDADNPGKTIVVNVRTAVPPIPHATYLHEWLVWRLGRIAAHEVREGYRVGGVAIFDPHAEDANE